MSPRPAKTHPVLKSLQNLLPSMAAALGADAELVLHELSHPEDSLIAIAGNVTNRKVGAPLTDLVLQIVRRGDTGKDLLNYSTTIDGKTIRSSTLFVRDQKGEVIGCLCINIDITKWVVARHLVNRFCETQSLDAGMQETFTSDVEAGLSLSIEKAVNEQGIPVAMMKKDDKLKVVRLLDEQGVFLIKRAVASVANALDVSRYTVYAYLDQVRGTKL